MINEKIEQAIGILEEFDVDMWLTFTRETSATPDPICDLILGTDVVWPSALMITKVSDCIAVVGNLDQQTVRDHASKYEVVGYHSSIKETLLEYLEKYDPLRIAINYSTNDVMADGLTHGMYLTLQEYLANTVYPDRLESGEKLVAALRGRKSPAEIENVKKAVAETLEIYDQTTKHVRAGMTEQDVARFIRERMREKGRTAAWTEDHCPSVFTGPDTAGAHAGPTKRKIEPGHIMNIDFGLRVDGYVSDLQRTWYFLRSGEKQAPPEVQKGFMTIRKAIQAAAAALRPGIEGWTVDSVARLHIVNAGYKEFPHALGHQVGRSAHDGAGLLCPKWDRYKNLPYLKVEEGQVYTLEPRLTVPGHGIVTIEEIVVVTEDGCEFLSDLQMELIYI